MTELKPCPFCGAKAQTFESNRHPRFRFGVECSLTNGFCWVYPQTDLFETEEEAIEAWNRRANE